MRKSVRRFLILKQKLSLILCDGILRKGTPAFAIDLDNVICVIRQAAELQADLAIFHRQDCIFGPGINVEFTVGLKGTEWQPNTARVEKESLAAAPHLLGMRMPACENIFVERAEEFLKPIFGYGRQNDIVKVCGGAVEAQQIKAFLKLNRDGRLKYGDEFLVIFCKL